MPMNDQRALLDRDLPGPDAWPCLLACLAVDGALQQANRAFTERLAIAHERHPGWVWSALLTPASLAELHALLPGRRDFSVTLVLKDTPTASRGIWLDLAA